MQAFKQVVERLDRHNRRINEEMICIARQSASVLGTKTVNPSVVLACVEIPYLPARSVDVVQIARISAALTNILMVLKLSRVVARLMKLAIDV